MIKKNYQINKNILKTDNFILFYGINEGSKSEKINELINMVEEGDIIFISVNSRLFDLHKNFAFSQ